MGGNSDSDTAPVRRIDEVAKGIFLDAVRHGARIRDAARAAGFTGKGLWKARRADPAFAEAVEEALEDSNVPRFIAPANGRRLQLSRPRRLRFDAWRREIFLDHFAGTCNETAAAEAAGVCRETVYRHRMRDPEFAAAHQAALETGYARLEAEVLQQRLEAQQRLRDGAIPQGELATEFERVLKLLARWERRGGAVGPRTVAHGRRKSWTFDEAITAIERKLKALAVPIPQLPPQDRDEEPCP
jgi:hypothetical protein